MRVKEPTKGSFGSGPTSERKPVVQPGDTLGRVVQLETVGTQQAVELRDPCLLGGHERSYAAFASRRETSWSGWRVLGSSGF